MSPRLGIAAVQMEYRAWDADATLSEFEHLVEQFSKDLPWVDVFVAPELAMSGFVHFKRATPDQLEDAVTTVPGPRVDRLAELARRTRRWLIPGSFWERDGEEVYNSTVVISPAGDVVAKYRKMFPWLPAEVGTTPGDSFCVFDIPDVGRIGVAICYDTWYPEVTRTLAWMGAEIVIRLSLTPTSDRDTEFVLSQANAAFNQVYFVDVNGLGPWGGGRSAIFDPAGRILQVASTTPTVLTEILDVATVRRTREEGTLGMCQTWKQLRDSEVEFEMYHDLAKGAIFDGLGPVQRIDTLPD